MGVPGVVVVELAVLEKFVTNDWERVRCQPCNQLLFGLFTRKVTSDTCISTRDPATKSIHFRTV